MNDELKKYANTAASRFNSYANWTASLDCFAVDLLHCALGAAGEAIEVLDAIIKLTECDPYPNAYGNLEKEFGDVAYYLVMAARLLNINLARHSDEMSKGHVANDPLMQSVGLFAESVKKYFFSPPSRKSTLKSMQNALLHAWIALLCEVNYHGMSMNRILEINVEKIMSRDQ